MRRAAAWLASALFMPAAFAADDAPMADAGRLASPAGLSALIACDGHPDDLLAIAPAVGDPLKAVAFGWRPLPAANMFMSEFELNAPVQVFGRSSTRIAFSGTAVMAVLDEADPHPLAKQLQLETAIDTPQKAMFGREVRSVDVVDRITGAPRIESAVLTVSTVATHPGKVLAGCSYGLDEPDTPQDAPAAAGK